MGETLWRTEHELEESFLRTRERADDLESGVLRLLEWYVAHLAPGDGKQEALAQIAQQVTTQDHAPRVTVDEDEIDALLRQEPGPVPEPVPERGAVVRDITTLDDLSHHFTQFEGPGGVAIEDVRLLPSRSTVWVVGDTHGDAHTTRRVIERVKPRVQAGAYCVLLGDYVNNGLRSLENLAAILRFRAEYPDNVVVLGGNHEVRETYATAAREYFETHWDNATSQPYLDKQPPAHYGNLRLEMITSYGIDDGERLYRRFAEWGSRLPYAALVSGEDVNAWTMLSHSLGLATALRTPSLSILDLVGVKAPDQRLIETCGFEAWKRLKTIDVDTQHAAMLNNRCLSDAGLGYFRRLGVARACVGHIHYRSGLEQSFGGVPVHTLCSSTKESVDAGHYMYQELVVERLEPGGAGFEEGLAREEAVPCVAEITDGGVTLHPLSLSESESESDRGVVAGTSPTTVGQDTLPGQDILPQTPFEEDLT